MSADPNVDVEGAVHILCNARINVDEQEIAVQQLADCSITTEHTLTMQLSGVALPQLLKLAGGTGGSGSVQTRVSAAKLINKLIELDHSCCVLFVDEVSRQNGLACIR